MAWNHWAEGAQYDAPPPMSRNGKRPSHQKGQRKSTGGGGGGEPR